MRSRNADARPARATSLAAATSDQAKKTKAKADLDGYRRDFDAFITGANPNLPKGAVADLLVEHVNGLIKAIDALAAKDYPAGYRDLKMAEDHSQMIADPLSGALHDSRAQAAGRAAGPRQDVLIDAVAEHAPLGARGCLCRESKSASPLHD